MTSVASSLASVERPLLGCALLIGSVFSAQLVARSGYEWVVVDMEHAPLSPLEVSHMVHAVVSASAGKCVPLVRLPAHGVEWIKWSLDCGAPGIVVPMVNNAREMEEVVQRVRYPPRGYRSFGPYLAPFADLDSGATVDKYLNETSKEIALFPLIESVEAVENAEEILSIDGVTGAMVGPFDLRASMGLPGGSGTEEKFVQAIEKVAGICKKLGKPAGTAAPDGAAVMQMTKAGYRMLLTGSDATLIVAGAKSMLSKCRESIG
jgi:4-hydroxy-2-oxoheptanedioate aldolase